jgi:serine/threonine-protein kinase
MPLADGQIFAGYTIGRILGAGGMGEVYLARHPRLPRHDALKVLGVEVSHDEEYRQRFNQEAEMVATLRHPNIVTIYDRGDFDGQLWIAMEFVDGTDASRLLTDKYPKGIPPAEVVRIITPIADALDYAHGRGLLHRDIKPANILLGVPESADDRIMLVDFGVARWVGQSSDLTGADMTVGTVNYAAPEQLKGEQIDGHADQYSLAATAYHLLTGAAPFANSNPAVVIGNHLSAQPPPIGTDHPDLARLGPVFARALAKDPSDRFDQCGDFATAMRDALGSAALGSAAGMAARHRKPEAVPGRKRWIAAALAALLVVSALGVALALLSVRRDTGTASIPTTPPPPAVSARMDLPVVVVGADCAVLGAAAVDNNGAPAYCARVDSQSIEAVWSPQPERLRTAGSRPPTAP